MTSDEFRVLVEEVRTSYPRWFALPSDTAPTEEEIRWSQERLCLEFPSEYLDFLRQEGGGDFAFVVVYSMDVDSGMNVVRMNESAWLRHDGFVAVSDNGAGDYYGFEVVDGRCRPEVLLVDHEFGEMRPTGHTDFFEFVASEGLRR